MKISRSIAEFPRQEIYCRPPPPRARHVLPQHSRFCFAHIRQLPAIALALGFGFGLWFVISNYTEPAPSYTYSAGMTYVGNGIYQMPDGTYTGDIPQGTDTSTWNDVVYPIGYPYGFCGGTMDNPRYYHNVVTGAYGSVGGGKDEDNQPEPSGSVSAESRRINKRNIQGLTTP